ncbi:phytanoyl-CoA dioxygenase family protein [Micromonospora sp. NPDC047812]|uniref:phytanoyl-CoA dioxygenase family protein n=1 Tax=Micromonospora sp. NPDC047812 TaxID=3155742 RepID=UPI003451C6A7
MMFSPTDLAALRSRYEEHGWCSPAARLSAASVAAVRQRIDELCASARPEVVHEDDGATVRAVHGCHAFDDLCAALVRTPELVRLAETLVGGEVYVYQFKVNLKQAEEGAAWPWHQDFSFWHLEDGMPRPAAVNIAISLDDVHDGNGPLLVVPGSHNEGIYELPRAEAQRGKHWREHVSTTLTYTVSDERAAELMATKGGLRMTGPAGTINAFHPSILHSSSNNDSPDRRALLLITYNRVDNAPAAPTRPEFLVARDTTPITAGPDDRLTLVAASA